MLTSLKRQFSKYLHVLRWLAHDFVWRYRRRVAIVLVFRFAGMGLFVSTFGLLAYYVRLIERDSSVRLFGESVHARESVMLLVLVGIIAVLALSVSSVMMYWSARGAMRLAQVYEDACGRRVLQLANRQRQFTTPEGMQETDERLILVLTRKYPRMIGRVARTIVVTLIPNSIVMLFVLPTLLVLSFSLTAIVIVLMGCSLFVHYRLNVAVAGNTVSLERTADQALQAFRGLIGRMSERLEPLDDSEIDRAYRRDPVRQNSETYVKSYLARDQSQFASDIFGAVTMAIVLIVLGSNVLQEGAGWSTLIAYLLVLRFTIAQIRSLLSGIAVANRYFHQVRAYILFIEHGRQRPSDTFGRHAESLTATLDEACEGTASEQSLSLHPGTCIAVVGPFRASRFQVQHLCDVLFSSEPGTANPILDRMHLVATPDQFHALSERTMAEQPAEEQGPRLLVIGEAALTGVEQPAETIRTILESRADIVIVLFTPAGTISRLPHHFVIVSDGAAVLWIGASEQFEARRSELLDLVRGSVYACNDASECIDD